MLGTGHAMTTKCFNTCFVYENEYGKMLVDTGGGQQLVGQLRAAGINADEINYVFISHRHTDHLLGLPWFIRMRLRNLSQKPLEIFAHEDLCRDAKQILFALFPELEQELGHGLIFHAVQHGEELSVCGRKFRFYDTRCKRCKQFGFVLTLKSGGTFVFNGDVPFHEENRSLMQNAEYLMHEAFALSNQLKQNPNGHSSVAQTAKHACDLCAKTLIVVHGSDHDLPMRQKQYTQEASQFFEGAILVPYDLDIIDL